MRKSALIATLFLCATSALSYSQDRETKQETNSTYRGRIDPLPFQKPFDFGYVPIDYKMVYRAPVNNLSQNLADSLQVFSLKSTCECTEASISSKLIEPGGSATVRISFDTKTFYGPQSRFVEINTSDPKTPELLATFEASVGGRPAEIDMLPRSIMSLPGSVIDTLKVKNFTSNRIPFTVVYQDSALFRVEIPESFVVGDGYAEIYLHHSKTLPSGSHLSTLTLEFQISGSNEPDSVTRRISTPIKLVRY